MLGGGAKPIKRCPHALARENPGDWAWARWASTAHAYLSTGNLAVMLRGSVELSIGGEDALNVYGNAISDRMAPKGK